MKMNRRNAAGAAAGAPQAPSGESSKIGPNVKVNFLSNFLVFFSLPSVPSASFHLHSFIIPISD